MVSLCILGCRGTRSVDQDGPKLRYSPVSASQVPVLKAFKGMHHHCPVFCFFGCFVFLKVVLINHSDVLKIIL